MTDGAELPICGTCMYWPKPKVVCLCGSTRFYDEFAQANLDLTLQGYIVLSIGCDTHHVDAQYTKEQKRALDRLHKFKIHLADEILVLNKDGYIGPSTRSEINYAEHLGKLVKYKYAVHS
jgi:hypothetical protein